MDKKIETEKIYELLLEKIMKCNSKHNSKSLEL
jgi:hypothetical protein